MNEVVIKATVNEEKESLSFSKLDAWRRIRRMRNQYGGEKRFSEVSGLGIAMIKKYCSESYMKKSGFKQSTWEKYFGPWDDKEPTFMMKLQKPAEDVEIQEAEENDISEATDIEIETEEKKEEISEVKMPRLILEVPSLEDLDATLELYGMKMIIE